jgi:hypothetical protein
MPVMNYFDIKSKICNQINTTKMEIKRGIVSSCLLEFLYHCILDYENKDYIYINEPLQLVNITTNVVISNITQAIQHYVIQFVSDLRRVVGFLWVLRFSSNNKTDRIIKRQSSTQVYGFSAFFTG